MGNTNEGFSPRRPSPRKRVAPRPSVSPINATATTSPFGGGVPPISPPVRPGTPAITPNAGTGTTGRGTPMMASERTSPTLGGGGSPPFQPPAAPPSITPAPTVPPTVPPTPAPSLGPNGAVPSISPNTPPGPKIGQAPGSGYVDTPAKQALYEGLGLRGQNSGWGKSYEDASQGLAQYGITVAPGPNGMPVYSKGGKSYQWTGAQHEGAGAGGLVDFLNQTGTDPSQVQELDRVMGQFGQAQRRDAYLAGRDPFGTGHGGPQSAYGIGQ